MLRDPSLEKLVQRFSIFTIATVANISSSAVSQWRKVPLSRVVLLAQSLQISPAEIRPDLFKEGTTVAEAAKYQLQHDPRSRAEVTKLFRKKIRGETITIRRTEWQAVKMMVLAGKSFYGTKTKRRHQQ